MGPTFWAERSGLWSVKGRDTFGRIGRKEKEDERDGCGLHVERWRMRKGRYKEFPRSTSKLTGNFQHSSSETAGKFMSMTYICHRHSATIILAPLIFQSQRQPPHLRPPTSGVPVAALLFLPSCWQPTPSSRSHFRAHERSDRPRAPQTEL